MGETLKEVRSGAHLALTILAALFVFCCLCTGLLFLNSGKITGLLFGIPVTVLTLVVLGLTVERWAKWFFALCFVTGLRTTAMIAFGRTLSAPSMVAPRSFFALLTAVCALMAFLSFHFVSAKPNRLDSICLVGALTALINALVATSRNVTLVSTSIAFLLLGLSWGKRNIVGGRSQRIEL